MIAWILPWQHFSESPPPSNDRSSLQATRAKPFPDWLPCPPGKEEKKTSPVKHSNHATKRENNASRKRTNESWTRLWQISLLQPKFDYCSHLCVSLSLCVQWWIWPQQRTTLISMEGSTPFSVSLFLSFPRVEMLLLFRWRELWNKRISVIERMDFFFFSDQRSWSLRRTKNWRQTQPVWSWQVCSAAQCLQSLTFASNLQQKAQLFWLKSNQDCNTSWCITVPSYLDTFPSIVW